MRLTLDPPTAHEFKQLYDETGWADWNTERLQRALDGSWLVVSARNDNGRLVGIGRMIGDGAVHALIVDLIVRETERAAGSAR